MVKLSKYYILFLVFLAPVTHSVLNAQTIKGKVLDASTGEPLVGAVVKLENTKYKTIVKLDGTYVFIKLPLATYSVKVYYEGYAATDLQTVTLTDNTTKIIGFNLKPTVTELSSITVTTTDGKGSDNGARRLEKISDPIINVLSAKQIQLLPDITVANAMQRISGVTIERSSTGEGRYPIIRGMEKRYINTLVNGIKIPSPDNKNRFIPLDLFPSELLDRLEVSKTLIPCMEGDAIGGTINLVMKDAPQKELIQVNASTGYSDIFFHQVYQHFAHTVINKKSPNEINGGNYTPQPTDFSTASLNYNDIKAPINSTLGVTYGNRFGTRKQFGLIVSGSYQDIFKGTNSTFFLPNAQTFLNNIPEFKDLEARTYSSQSKRIGLNAKLDYELNKNNKISWVNTYVRLDDYLTRFLNDTTVLNSLVDVSYRSTYQYQSIYNSTLQGIHNLTPSLKFDWSLVYSIANNHKPDEVEFTHERPVIITPLAGDIVSSVKHIWSHNSDKDYDVYANLTKETKLLGRTLELKLGGLIRAKTRDNFYNEYTLDPTLAANGSQQLYTNVNNAQFTFKSGNYITNVNNGNIYTFNETVSAGYLQGKWQLSDRLEALGGVRVEYTHQHYSTLLDSSAPAISGSIWYTDVLPSFQFKYKIDKTQSLRLAYYKALTRPAFAEMIPAGPNSYEDFPEVGNPTGLNHTTADNIDVRYELFSAKADQILLGAFYKNINDPIEFTIAPSGVTSQELKPENFGTATNFGFEALITKYLGSFGVSASYTFTQSQITSSKAFTYRDSTTGTIKTKSINETRPLQGQSKNVGNISLLYKNQKIGLDMQLAFVYTGERIAYVNPNYGLDYWQTPSNQLDFSFEKRIIKKLSVYGKLNNLANTPYTLSLHQSYNIYLLQSGARVLPLQTDAANKIFVQKDYYKATYLFGVRYKF